MTTKAKNPYEIIKHLHVTEKSQTLNALQSSESNKSVKKFQLPKYVFIVDRNANKHEIAHALEEIYADRHIKVTKVNTIQVKPKARRVRGRLGMTKGFKKAVVTLEKGDSLE